MIPLPRWRGVYLPQFEPTQNTQSVFIGIAFLYLTISLLGNQIDTAKAQAIYPDPSLFVCDNVPPAIEIPNQTPLPKPKPPAPAKVKTVKKSWPQPPEVINSLIDSYASQYGIDSNKMKKMAACESGFNPNAVNSVYGGLYQYVSSTWIATRKRMGLDPDPNLRFNAEEAIKTTAFKIAKDGWGAWPVCGKL